MSTELAAMHATTVPASEVVRPSGKPLRAVVIGGSGQLGGWLMRILQERGHTAAGTFATVPFPGLVPLDAGDLETAAGWVHAQAPDVVFYPAGFTWVDGCEQDPARAYAANLEQPLNLARAAAATGARFIYFSTDYVFDGISGPYSEESATHPLSVYGKAKYDAERCLPASWATASSPSAPPGCSAPSGRARTSRTSCCATCAGQAHGVPLRPGLQPQLRPGCGTGSGAAHGKRDERVDPRGRPRGHGPG